MFGKNILTDASLEKLADAQAAGGALVVSQSIRMGGYQTVLFFGSITTANPANIATIRQSSDNGITFRDLAGASLAVSADGNVWAIEIYQPSAHELRVEIARGVATATGEIWCLRMTGRRQSARQLPNVETLLLQSPEEVNP